MKEFNIGQTVKVISGSGVEHIEELVGQIGTVEDIDIATPAGEIGYDVHLPGTGYTMMFYAHELEAVE